MNKKYTIIKEVDPPKNSSSKKAKWVLIKCKCGKEYIERKNFVLWGNKKICDCNNNHHMVRNYHPNYKHGMSNTPLWRVWKSMVSRCEKSNLKVYKYYGGRGIKVCSEWVNDFLAFNDWALNNKYRKGLHLDRIDNDGDYTPENCRFVTSKVNMRNTSRKLLIKYNGEEKTLADWSDYLNIPYHLLYRRIFVFNNPVDYVFMTKGIKQKKEIDIEFANTAKLKLKSSGRTQRWLVKQMVEMGVKIDDYALSEKINGHRYMSDNEKKVINEILGLM